MNERVELSASERMALMNEEGKHFIVNGETADKAILREKKMQVNDCIREVEDKFAKHDASMENYSKMVSDSMNGLEILPMFTYVMIKPFEQNPFQQIKMTESGIITDLAGYTPTHKSNETGEWEEDTQYIKVGQVVETGHRCEFLKEGDVVFYTIASQMMVPFYKEGLVVVAENRIIAVVNDDLTKRKEEFKNGK